MPNHLCAILIVVFVALARRKCCHKQIFWFVVGSFLIYKHTTNNTHMPIFASIVAGCHSDSLFSRMLGCKECQTLCPNNVVIETWLSTSF